MLIWIWISSIIHFLETSRIKGSRVYCIPSVCLSPPPLPGRRCASLWTSPVWMERRRAPLPPLSVTQRITARPDAAGVTGALISMGLRASKDRDRAKISRFASVRSLTPRRTMLGPRLSVGDRTWELRSIDQDTFYILIYPFPSYLPLHNSAIISHPTAF